MLRNGRLEAFGPASLVLGKLGENPKVLPFAPPRNQQVSA